MLLLLAATILIVRIVGLRAFTKMSGFDFALTVATGSVLASALMSSDMSVWRGVGALAVIFAVQWLTARARANWEPVRQAIDNQPLLLMDGGTFLDDNLAASRVTRSDVIAKLREANVQHLGQVRAVVLESTGDVSVLHAEGDDADFDADLLLEGVRRS
ncbi:DUF421 domain-containing protein [Roseobacter sp. HKCCA0434]|uniref:DUF421 domain-containing protein n=1 Tax=Roseobacter sp. HKCCA0434 TaxID=3079297 RepID=UPI002905F1EC|nr:YetF domain-containing protein [Roseobacter sp. HKCCA0434]